MSVFETCSAGARPKTMPVARQTAAKNAKTLPSMRELEVERPADVLRRGIEPADADDREQPARARRRWPASSTLSTSSCRTMRQRVAPSETRIAISRARAVARQQQVGDVGARDEQHEADGAHQREKHQPDRPP